MLSENILALRTSLARFVETGVIVEPQAMVEICILLDTMKKDAHAMEQALHAPMVTLSDLITGKVVPLREGVFPVLVGDAT